MATIVTTQLMNEGNDWYGDGLFASGPDAISKHTAKKIVYTTDSGLTVTISGKGFAYDGPGGAPSDGVIGSVKITKAGAEWMTVTKLSLDLPDAFFTLFGWEGNNGNHQDGNSFDTFSLLTAGNDSIVGTDGFDDLMAGRNIGNDTIRAMGGDDYVKGSAGNNSMDGGAGDHDMLTYEESFYDVYAYRGAVINLETQKVSNPWGGTDTIEGFERFAGSRLRDKFVGSDADDLFAGMRGADTINGGDGFDTADYGRDERYGGVNGVVANLETGVIRDGFGSKDKAISVESVMGTSAADTFTGSDVDNQFYGGRGRDSFNGGDGDDEVVFWRNDDEGVGVVVDLTRASNQIQNDGYGNKETLVSIEDLAGGRADDRFTGSNVRNLLWGEDGNDTMNGKGGDDVFKGGRGSDEMTGASGSDRFQFDSIEESGNDDSSRDIITDFKVGSDKLDLKRIFDADLDTAGEQDFIFKGNGAITGRGQINFSFEGQGTGTTDDDRTIVRANVTGSNAAEFEIELIGIKNLSANDFILV